MFIVDRSAPAPMPERARARVPRRTAVVPRPQSCRSCQHYDAPTDGFGLRLPEHGRVYPCLVPAAPPSTPHEAQPSSFLFYPWRTPPMRRYMGPTEGRSCPAYEKVPR